MTDLDEFERLRRRGLDRLLVAEHLRDAHYRLANVRTVTLNKASLTDEEWDAISQEADRLWDLSFHISPEAWATAEASQ